MSATLTTATLATGIRPEISPYVERPIRFLELWQPPGWRLKVYGIAYGRPEPDAEFVAAAKRLALDVLQGASGYGLGFVGAHQARTGFYAFVGWWADENELHYKPFLGPSPDRLHSAGPDDSMACVWDLVVDFERRAWHELIVKWLSGPDVGAYLERRLEGSI